MTVEEKREYIYEYFLRYPTSTLRDISINTGISKSSIQRYLEGYAQVIIPETGLSIREQLQINKAEGQRKGGITYFRNNDHIKRADGLFDGSVESRVNYDKEEKKRVDIYIICSYFIDNYPKTLDQMVMELESIGMYSKSYIHDCLHDDRIVEVLGPAKSKQLVELLSTVRRDVYKSKRGKK